MTPDDIEWCDPPEAPKWSNRNRVQEFVNILRQRPGQWAKYPHPISASTTRQHARRHPARYPGTEWVSRRGELYGRWVGE